MAKNIQQKVTPQFRDASIKKKQKKKTKTKKKDNHFTLGFFKKLFASTAPTF